MGMNEGLKERMGNCGNEQRPCERIVGEIELWEKMEKCESYREL